MKHIKRAIVIGCTLLGLFLFVNESRVNANSLVEEVSSKIIRFHVIANSDSNEDQDLKIGLRNYISSYMKTILEGTDSVEEARKCISENLETIKELSEDYTGREIKVTLGKSYFPVKTYGDFTFPSGEYEALKIIIGKGEGKNWWCVMYPNLCFVDESYGVVEKDSKELLKKNLSKDAYNMLSASGEGRLRIKSAILEKLIFYLNI